MKRLNDTGHFDIPTSLFVDFLRVLNVPLIRIVEDERRNIAQANVKRLDARLTLMRSGIDAQSIARLESMRAQVS